MPMASLHIYLLPSAELLTQHPTPQGEHKGNKKGQGGGGDRPSIKGHATWQRAGLCQQEQWEKVKKEAQGGFFQLF